MKGNPVQQTRIQQFSPKLLDHVALKQKNKQKTLKPFLKTYIVFEVNTQSLRNHVIFKSISCWQVPFWLISTFLPSLGLVTTPPHSAFQFLVTCLLFLFFPHFLTPVLPPLGLFSYSNLYTHLHSHANIQILQYYIILGNIGYTFLINPFVFKFCQQNFIQLTFYVLRNIFPIQYYM